MTTKEQVYNAKKMYHQAVRNYLDTAKKAIVENHVVHLMDDASDEDGKPVRIHIRDCYPAFDIAALNLNSDSEILFHVVDGGTLFPNNTWVSDSKLSDDNLLELFDYIVWDD